MFCPNCGKDCGNAKFCPECGTNLQGIDPQIDIMSNSKGYHSREPKQSQPLKPILPSEFNAPPNMHVPKRFSPSRIVCAVIFFVFALIMFTAATQSDVATGVVFGIGFALTGLYSLLNQRRHFGGRVALFAVLTFVAGFIASMISIGVNVSKVEATSTSSIMYSASSTASQQGTNINSSKPETSKSPTPSEAPKASETPKASEKPKASQAPSSKSSPSVSLGEINALKTALDYLDSMPFSYKGLIEQLEYEGYSDKEAKYGADHCGANWNEQAKKMAQSYLESMSFSRQGLLDQLEYEGFTSEQAEYGVNAVGY